MVGTPCSSRWPYNHVHIDSIILTPCAIKEEDKEEKEEEEGEENVIKTSQERRHGKLEIGNSM